MQSVTHSFILSLELFLLTAPISSFIVFNNSPKSQLVEVTHSPFYKYLSMAEQLVQSVGLLATKQSPALPLNNIS